MAAKFESTLLFVNPTNGCGVVVLVWFLQYLGLLVYPTIYKKNRPVTKAVLSIALHCEVSLLNPLLAYRVQTAMAAVNLRPTCGLMVALSDVIPNALFIVGVGVGTLAALMLVLITVYFDRYIISKKRDLHLFMNKSPLATSLKDVDGKYIYANTLYRDLFGIQEDGKTDFDYFSDEIAQKLRENDLWVLETGKPLITEELAPTSDGIMRDWLSYKFRFTNCKGANFLAGVALDISERKRSEAHLKDYAEKLAQSNEELERFAYVASHDLKTPLRTISTRLKFLARSLGTPSEDVQHQIERISLAVARLDQLLNDLLAYSRVDTQAKELVPTDTQAVIIPVLESLEGLVQDKQAVVQVQLELPIVLADSVQLGQVFQNLISNGIKFCTRQPRITISATCQAQECTFCVADNGIGIPEKSKQQIFEVFQRLHSQSEYEGSGIGLSIIKKVIQRHGGRIWVESKPKQGSQFFFTLKEAKNERE